MHPEPKKGPQVRLLVTMALPYANGDIHLGHLLEAVQTDIYVRYQKLRGNEAVYVAADDTHGTPIELSALRQGITPEELVGRAMADHIRDYAGFDIGFDIFSSTNSEENRVYAERIYENLKTNGLIVEREINQFYCEHDRRFLPDRFIVGICPKCRTPEQYGDVCESCGTTYQPTDLGDPHCMICRRTPVMKKSKHLYVRLSECEQFLRGFIARPGLLQDDMRNFVQTWIDDGLREWCISRDGPYFGFRIPGTADKYFYVWLDAPIGYLSSTALWCRDHGRSVEEFWSKESDVRVVHFIGKDIVYFHTLFWPVLLSNSGFKLPSTIFVHGFLNIGGEKMSKSRGTFILAKDFLSKIKHPQASEFLRFFFAAKLGRTSADIDMNAPEFIARVNTTLANNFGNLHHRTFVFCDRYFDKRIPDAPWDNHIAEIARSAATEIGQFYENAEYKSVVERVHELGNFGNKYYQDNKPWELIKTDPAAAAAIMVTCVNLIRAMAVFLKPIVPKMIASLEQQLCLGRPLAWSDYDFSLSNLPLGATEKLVTPLVFEDLAPLFTPVEPDKEANAPAQVDIDAFRKVELRVATIIAAEKIEKSKKLIRLQVDLGTEKRQILAGIAESYAPQELVGRQAIAITNLKPASLMGHKSEGMLLAATGPDGKPILLAPGKADGGRSNGFMSAFTAARERITVRKVDEAAVDRLAAELRVPSAAARILVARNLTDAESCRRFFRPSINGFYDPFRFADMEKAVARILGAIGKSEKIAIFGDYDVDGITGTAMLTHGLRLLGASCDYYLPYRLTDGYGVSDAGVRQIAESGAALMITVDCGITAIEEVALASELGLDVIVTDHHEPKESLPAALALLNPKVASCGYPDRDLAGVGVVFKLCQALGQATGRGNAFWEPYLDLAALGTAADIVPLVGENRIITRFGFERIRTTGNVGLAALIELQGLAGKQFSTSEAVFQLAPSINAAGRIGDPRRAVDLLLTTNANVAAECARELRSANYERRAINSNVWDEAEAWVTAHCDDDHDVAIVAGNAAWHPGVIGIVASKLVEKFHRPAILFSIAPDGSARGSGRSIPGLHLLDALAECADLLDDFGGHAAAAGMSCKSGRLGAFRERFNAVVAQRVSPESLYPSVCADAELPLSALTPELFSCIKAMEPFGPGNMQPVLLCRDLRHRCTPRIVGNRHLKMTVSDGPLVMDAIAFNFGDRLDELKAVSTLSLAFALDENEWNGRKSLQMKVKGIAL